MSEPQILLKSKDNEQKNLLNNEEIKDADDLDIDNDDFKKNKKNTNSKYSIKYGRFALSAFTGSVSFTTNAANILATSASFALVAATVTFSFIGSAVGFGMGSYLTIKHCEALLDKFVEIFLENAKSLSNSLEIGLNYFRKMANIYRKKNLDL